VSEKERRFQFYGRRKGKTLRPHHAKLIAELLPQLQFDPAHFDFTRKPVRLEIGFGGGEHLAHQAELHRDIGFIGAEPFVNGVAKLLAFIEARNLQNVSIHAGDVRELFDLLPAQSLERIYLLYPDPWPKARHHRRRLVSPESQRNRYGLRSLAKSPLHPPSVTPTKVGARASVSTFCQRSVSLRHVRS